MKLEWCKRKERDESSERDESPERPLKMSIQIPGVTIQNTVPKETMDALIKRLQSGLGELKGRKKREVVMQAGLVFSDSKSFEGCQVTSKNVISFDYQPGPPRAVNLVYVSGVKHRIQQDD